MENDEKQNDDDKSSMSIEDEFDINKIAIWAIYISFHNFLCEKNSFFNNICSIINYAKCILFFM